jgi:hypothetical protein
MSQLTHTPARTRRASSASLVPGLIAVALLGAAIAVGVLNGPEPAPAQAAADATPGPRPFADMPPEQPPERISRSGGSFTRAPEGLANEQIWVDATALAKAAEELFQETLTAKRAGDQTTANTKGRLAREKFNQAAEMTALWEEELMEKHGDRDPKVREIKRARTKWFSRLDWLLKGIAR